MILPCLDEAAGLAWLLPRLPADARAIVVDNGSTDASCVVARAHGALVVHELRRGYGAARHAGLLAASADVVAFCDADGSLDPADLARVTRPVLDGEADLVVGRRIPARGAWPWHLRLANRELARRVRRRTGVRLLDVGPLRAARRVPFLDLGLQDRRSGYPVETVVAAAAAGWRVREVPVRYRPRSGRSKVTGTPLGAWRAVRDMTRILRTPPARASAGGAVEPPRTTIVLAKAPVPGRAKTRLIGAFSPDDAAQLAAAALADTLDAVLASGVEHCVLVLDGEPGPWVPAGVRVLPQRPGGLDRRIAHAFDDVLRTCASPALLVGMDTPQLGTVLRDVDFAGHDAVLGLAADGGFWAVGLREADPDLFLGVEMSTERTGAEQLDRLRAAGLRVALLPPLRDVDVPDDATDVARAAPGTRFARTWRALTGTADHRVGHSDDEVEAGPWTSHR